METFGEGKSIMIIPWHNIDYSWEGCTRVRSMTTTTTSTTTTATTTTLITTTTIIVITRREKIATVIISIQCHRQPNWKLATTIKNDAKIGILIDK